MGVRLLLLMIILLFLGLEELVVEVVIYHEVALGGLPLQDVIDRGSFAEVYLLLVGIPVGLVVLVVVVFWVVVLGLELVVVLELLGEVRAGENFVEGGAGVLLL